MKSLCPEEVSGNVVTTRNKYVKYWTNILDNTRTISFGCEGILSALIMGRVNPKRGPEYSVKAKEVAFIFNKNKMGLPALL